MSKAFWLIPYCAITLCACTKKDKEMSIIFQADNSGEIACPDLSELEQNGEIIAVTLSGPDTYYDFRGQSFGLQYELMADFARSKGLRIRMEIAHDTLELVQMLQKGDADVVALPMHAAENCILAAIQDSTATGNANHKMPIGWLTRSSSTKLAEALDNWYKPSIKEELTLKQQQLKDHKRTFVAKQHPRPKVKDKAHGIISDYDGLLKTYAQRCGWDWKLLAAQCYQESAFDPNAVSWAGAQGLMQLMPATAKHYGVQEVVFTPEHNISAAARMINDLDAAFSEISNKDERINFILASYNGGQGHVRDAMALTEKYGGNKYAWKDVREYILLLSNATYFRDPCVKYGYINGKETANYVSAVRSHWGYYANL